jgi:hypothetical protein
MGGAFSAYGGGERCVQGFGGEGDHWGDPGIDGRMDLQEVGCGCVDWMELAEDKDRWRELVSAVMNLRVP